MNARKEPKTAEQSQAVPRDQREQITELVTAFIAAKSPGEMSPLLREPEKYAPVMNAWLSAHPGSLPIGGQIGKIGYLRDVSGTRVSNVIVSLPTGQKKVVLTVETPAGFRVDWRAFSETGDMTVAQFVDQKPAAPTLLIAAVRRSDYYNNAYNSRNVWECLKVSAGNGESSFYAYVPRSNTALMAALAGLPPMPAKRGLKEADPRPMALRAGFVQPNTGEILQAEVESVIADGWYVP